jgi:large conductance mechanosensitive channel
VAAERHLLAQLVAHRSAAYSSPRNAAEGFATAPPNVATMEGLLRDFKAFLLRGNVIDLAVAFVIGVAFTAVVQALVGDLLTPIIAAIFGKPNFSDLYFTINNSQFLYGGFLDALITFVSVAAAVFLFVVKPVNAMVAVRARGQGDSDPTIKQCPECLSEIPVAASRCAYCTQAQPAIA